jgi:N-acetyltransferase 10
VSISVQICDPLSAQDVHARYRTSSHDSVIARFNERFILSLGSCTDCLVLDDELNVLPISRGKDIQPLEENHDTGKAEPELKDLKTSLADTKPAGDLVTLTKTLDQAQAILTFIEAIAEKTLSSTVTLTAARGRGKSAALGLAIAAALAHGYSNIFVTSPSPENLKTLFEFTFKGMDVLGYEEHLDYDISQSTNPEFNKAIVRVNIFRDHRQTIQVSTAGFDGLERIVDDLVDCSTFNQRMLTYWDRQSLSSSTKPPQYLFRSSEIS